MQAAFEIVILFDISACPGQRKNVSFLFIGFGDLALGRYEAWVVFVFARFRNSFLFYLKDGTGTEFVKLIWHNDNLRLLLLLFVLIFVWVTGAFGFGRRLLDLDLLVYDIIKGIIFSVIWTESVIEQVDIAIYVDHLRDW